ncbi:amphiregulin-like isoform X2 [Carcharodon carcharias]|uniref:amphiregulin-like isoform X2 n=1 Tax=Carcharodon carcharias TaxID=13397 RepID=UPI001B7F31E8|nr:amphiregulin-like isoform X2 [Carcharodon carcharias]
MIKLQALYLLLAVVVTAAGVREVDGTSLAEDENKLLVSSGAPASEPPIFSPNYSQRVTNDSSEDYEDYVQQVVQPKDQDRKKKNSKKSKSKGKRRRTGRKKQKDPCKTDYKDYCIHGKCQYLKDLNKPSCVCLPGYQNERCGIRALYTGTTEESIDSLSIVLVVAAVMLLISIITAVIVVTLRIRRKMRVEHDILSEEKQTLRTENGVVVEK